MKKLKMGGKIHRVIENTKLGKIHIRDNEPSYENNNKNIIRISSNQ